VDALSGKTFKGQVTLVGDQALLRSTGQATSTSTTGTEEAKDFKVVVTLTGTAQELDELRPGLSCTAKITTAHKQGVPSLPIQALTMYDPAQDSKKSSGTVQAASTTPGQAPAKPNLIQGVFIVEKDAHGKLRVKFVPVTTGITGATDIEVVNGPPPGAEIVTGPYKTLRILKDGALVKRDTVKPITLSTSSSSS
jgi:HlyD family secretion protein